MDEMVSWAPLLAVAVLVLNDHVLKGAGVLPGWLTGKLSDLAGLFFFPLFLSAMVGLIRRRPPTLRRLLVCAGITAVLFTGLQLSDSFIALYEWSHEKVLPWPVHVTPDPTDLLALPMVGLSVLWGRRYVPKETGP